MLEDDNIVAPEEIFFTLNVNAEVRVLFVEIVDGHILQGTHGRDQSPVNPGFLQGRVGKLDQDSFSHGGLVICYRCVAVRIKPVRFRSRVGVLPTEGCDENGAKASIGNVSVCWFVGERGETSSGPWVANPCF